MNIYVSNLPHSASSNDLHDLFVTFGEVTSARVINDRETGRSRGFGFVEMANNEESKSAISSLHESQFGGRALNVNEARPKTYNSGGYR